MSRNKLLIGALISSSLLAVLHLSAFEFHWYWSYWWFDILTHLIGGISVGFILLFLYLKYRSAERSITKKEIFMVSIFGVLVVGLLWEIFEFVIGGNGFAESGFTADSISDVFTDIAGGAIVYVIMNSTYSSR